MPRAWSKSALAAVAATRSASIVAALSRHGKDPLERGNPLMCCTTAPLFRLQSRELFARNDPQLGPHGVMSRSAKFAARHFICARMWKLQLRFADRSGQDLDFIVSAIEGERVYRIGAGDAKMNGDPSGNQNAVRDEQVLLSDHSHRDRSIRVLLSAKIVLDELSGQVKGQGIDVARAPQKTQQGQVDLIITGGWDQGQNQHGQQERS